MLKEVEKVYGRRVATTTDFELLSVVIGQEVGEFLSASTLKRLWRYVGDTRTPRGKTLDILSRYIGKKNFQEFCKMLMGGGVDYQPFMEKYVRAEELSAGDNIVVGGGMDRLLKVRYLGEGRFKVLTNLNLKMKEGDEFEADKFLFQISRSK